jgi:hypothetical protein
MTSPFTALLVSVVCALLCVTAASAAELTHTVLVDHFDNKNTDTWEQEWFLNATFWNLGKGKGPVLVCVGGEGPPLDPSVVISSVHCDDAVRFAQESNGLLVGVQVCECVSVCVSVCV